MEPSGEYAGRFFFLNDTQKVVDGLFNKIIFLALNDSKNEDHLFNNPSSLF
jgi:hypothetical protein